MRLSWVAATLVAAMAVPRLAAAGPFGSELTMTTNFFIGSIDDRGRDAFAAPGGHFDLGLGNRTGRVAVDLMRSMWTREDVEQEHPDRTGSFGRLGVTARGNLHNFDFGLHDVRDRPRGTMHLYLEVGAGKQWLKGGASPVFTRDDVSFGIGLQQVAHTGGGLLGADVEFRVLVSRDEPERGLACAGRCETSAAVTDAAFIFGTGLIFGS